MTDREKMVLRFHRALDRIGIARLLTLPEPMQEALKKTTNLEVKTRMLEAIADGRYNEIRRVQGDGHKGA